MARTRSSASLFDQWSLRYDRRGLQRLTYRPVHDAVLRRLQHSDPSVVVDLGCGTGQLTQRLVRRFPGATIVGVDLSEGMLAQAAGRLAGPWIGATRLVRADAVQIPFAVSSVDVVVCTESFHWYSDQARVLSELAGVLRPGGRLLIASIATMTSVGDRLLTDATGSGQSAIRARPPHDMRRLLARAGFEVIYQRRVPRLGLIAWPVLTDARRR
jgi:ubiquinone/menaquinone biosynthesis C-methylase UbiE